MHARIISMAANSQDGLFCIWDIWSRPGWVEGQLWTSTSKLGKHLAQISLSSYLIKIGQGWVEGRRAISWHQHLNCARTSTNPIPETLLTLSYVVHVNWCLAMGHYSFKWVEGRRVVSRHQHLNWGSILCRPEHPLFISFCTKHWLVAQIFCVATTNIFISGRWVGARREGHLLTSTSKLCIVHFA